MLAIAYYFLQVVLCSAVMMGYYWMVLRNKRFHQYNRFYLLLVLALSWIVPLIKIQFVKPVASDAQMINFLSIVADSNSEIDASIAHQSFQFSWEGAATIVYFLVAFILFSVLLYGLVRLYFLLKKHSCKNVGEVYLIITQLKGAPFSFFKYIFWHEAIDIRTDAGKQMLEHELAHVQQKHSVDKIIIQLVLIAGWFNPFFWLLKKEMEMIHEFIADKKAVNNGDTASLAQMLLTAAYPQQQYLLTNPFFFSPIKRRLQMIANNKNSRFNYLRRLIALPLLAIVVVLFAFRSKDRIKSDPISVQSLMEQFAHRLSNNKSNNTIPFNSVALNKTYTVVIDAGHGGQDKGAIGIDGNTTESVIALQFAKALVAANKNSRINIVLTRTGDASQTVMEKTIFANKQNPDLFISLHCNASEPVKIGEALNQQNPNSGVEIFIANKEKAINYNANLSLANQIAATIKQADLNLIGVKSSAKGIWVMQSVNCPSILIEAGFLSNSSDLKKLKDPVYQQQFAATVLGGIENYLLANEQNNVKKDTIIIKADTVVVVSSGTTLLNPIVSTVNSDIDKALMILDGKKVDISVVKLMDPNLIANINVLKGESAKALYGEEGRNGVVVIVSKIANTSTVGKNDPSGIDAFLKRNPDVKEVHWRHQPNLKIVLTLKDGTEEIYDLSVLESTQRASNKYGKLPIAPPPPPMVKNFNIGGNNVTVFNANQNEVSMIGAKSMFDSKVQYYKDGVKVDSLSLKTTDPSNIARINVLKGENAVKKYGAEAADGVIEIFTKYAAATESAQVYKVFTVTEIAPSFPGGDLAWAKYLKRNLSNRFLTENNAPAGIYKVEVVFNVDANGSINNVRTSNNPGYGTKEAAENLIKKGPMWKPGMQKGIAVNAMATRIISFELKEPE